MHVLLAGPGVGEAGPAERLLDISAALGARTRVGGGLEDAGAKFPLNMKNFMVHKLAAAE